MNKYDNSNAQNKIIKHVIIKGGKSSANVLNSILEAYS